MNESMNSYHHQKLFQETEVSEPAKGMPLQRWICKNRYIYGDDNTV
jgi:hypothetical protein